MAQLLHARRRAIRRRVRSACRAVHWGRFQLVGERLIDLSPEGALLACDAEVRVGDELLVTFRMPWAGPEVLVMAEVTRVIGGWREGDPGYCAGLRFLDLLPEERAELRERCGQLRRTAPARPHPVDYARTVRSIAHHLASEPGVLAEPRAQA